MTRKAKYPNAHQVRLVERALASPGTMRDAAVRSGVPIELVSSALKALSFRHCITEMGCVDGEMVFKRCIR